MTTWPPDTYQDEIKNIFYKTKRELTFKNTVFVYTSGIKCHKAGTRSAGVEKSNLRSTWESTLGNRITWKMVSVAGISLEDREILSGLGGTAVCGGGGAVRAKLGVLLERG